MAPKGYSIEFRLPRRARWALCIGDWLWGLGLRRLGRCLMSAGTSRMEMWFGPKRGWERVPYRGWFYEEEKLDA